MTWPTTDWLPLVGFAFASSITPGPNNLMLSASGIAFGLQRTLPHLAGVLVGFMSLLLLCGSGIGSLMLAYPVAGLALKACGTVYLVYLAWKMRNAIAPRHVDASAQPLTFAAAVAFQYVNPKAWVMALTAVSVFVPDVTPRWLAVAAVCGVFGAVNVPCVCTWTVLGVSLRRWLAHERLRRRLSLVIAVLMLSAVAAIWMDGGR
jgi:threonine/homoserine/homoserine lactone efflux protein